MFKKPIEIEFVTNKDYVLQPIKFNLRNIRATYKMIRDWSIMKYFCAIPRVEGEGLRAKGLNLLIATMTIKELSKEPYNYVVVHKPTGEVAACVALRPGKTLSDSKGQDVGTLNLSVAAFKEYRKRHIVYEAGKKAVELAMENQGVKNIEALTLPGNVNSRRLLKKSGFEYEGTQKSPDTWYREKDKDVMRWNLSREKAAKLGLA